MVNDSELLADYYEKHKDEIFIGYNIRGYDQYVMKAILLGLSPQRVNDWIIKEHKPGWKYSRMFNQVKLNIYDTLFGGKSLKLLEGFMGNNIRETSIPFNYDGDFTDGMIEEILHYNKHDVQQDIEVFLNRKEEFDSMMALIKEFNLPLNCIGKTQAQLAAIILKATRVDYNDGWDIRLPDTLKLNKYQYVADWFMNPANHTENAYLETDIAGTPHIFANGGVHGAIPNFIYECKENEVMLMADVGQLYPSLMVEYGLLSRGVSDYEDFKMILSESLRLKAIGDKAAREPYKRICNITYGAMGDKYNAMYDPLHRTLVCVFGQVLIVMLIEMLEERVPGFMLIQSNTDGILIKFDEQFFDLVDDIVYEWEQQTRLKMEFDYFKKIWQADVNNYVGVMENGKIKAKGKFFKFTSPLDNDLPIVQKAIMDYLLQGVSIEKTIDDCDDLMQFQQICRVSGKYMHALKNCTFTKFRGKNVWNGDGEALNEKTLRVFASKLSSDGGVYKLKDKEKNPEKFADTSEHCFIFNESVVGVKCPKKLDKQYYIDMAKERLVKKFGNKII